MLLNMHILHEVTQDSEKADPTLHVEVDSALHILNDALHHTACLLYKCCMSGYLQSAELVFM